MAKKPGPVAGSLGNTDYYYKSDGTVVDENGIPASARISAMFAAPAPVEAAAVEVAPKRKKKNNAQIAGVLKNTKYYYAPDGSIIDDQGKPAPDKIAAYFPPQEKREAIAAAMPKAPGIKAATKATGVPSKVIKQFNRNVSIATNLITTNQKIMESYPKLFEQMSGVVQKMTEQNETVIRSMIQNNQEFQDKVIETLTGAKAPTQAGGSVAPKPGRKGAGRKSLKTNRSAAVLARAQRMKQSRSASNTRLGIGLAVAGTAVAVGAALIATSPGGGGTGGEAPPGGMWPNTPSSGSNKQVLETIKKRESGGDYNIRSKSSSASGAYQFIDSTWRGRAQKAGVDIQKYPRAFMAPPDVQDKVADVYISEILRQNNNDVSKIPLVWYTGNAAGQMSAGALAVNKGLTPQAYQASWMKTYQQMGGSTQTAAAPQTTPTAPATPTIPAATTGAPERRPSATPEEASTHQANVTMLKNINDLAAKKGPGARLGEANEAKKKELEGKVAAFNQKFSLAPIQQAGTVRPLDTTGAPSQQQTQQGTGGGNTSKPNNVTGNVDVSKVDPELMKRFYQAASEYGGPVRINSAYRDDAYQAQLWVRGNILREPGIYTPARPQNTQVVTVGGKSYTVPGSGRGSSHGKGQALDITPGLGSAFQGILAKYGVVFPFGGSDPVHIQLAGGSNYQAPSTSVPGAPAPDYYAGGGAGNRMAGASQDYAVNRACACPPMNTAIINRTVTNDIRTNIFQQMAGPTYRPQSMISPFMIGAEIGSALRRLF